MWPEYPWDTRRAAVAELPVGSAVPTAGRATTIIYDMFIIFNSVLIIYSRYDFF